MYEGYFNMPRKNGKTEAHRHLVEFAAEYLKLAYPPLFVKHPISDMIIQPGTLMYDKGAETESEIPWDRINQQIDALIEQNKEKTVGVNKISFFGEDLEFKKLPDGSLYVFAEDENDGEAVGITMDPVQADQLRKFLEQPYVSPTVYTIDGRFKKRPTMVSFEDGSCSSVEATVW